MTSIAFSQSWCKRSNFPGAGQRSGTGFTIGNKGYHCFGTNGFNNSNQLWEYDAPSDSWTRRTNYSGPGRRSGISFTIGNEAYVGLGWEGSRVFNDFSKYNQLTNSWTLLDSFPSQATVGSMAVSYNGKGYLIGGAESGNIVANQFYEYSPTLNSWTLISSNIPIGQRMEGIMEVIGNEFYIGLGHDFNFAFNDFWRYTPLGNTWAQMAPFPGTPRLNPISFAANNKLIVGGGYNLGAATQFSDYYEYDPVTNIWTQVSGFISGDRSRSSSFVIADSAYISGGWVGTNDSEVWRYAPFAFRRTDTVVCEGDVFTLDVGRSGGRYQWHNNSFSSTFRVTEPGIFWVNITTTNECTRRDSFVVDYTPLPLVDLGNDTSFCSKIPYTVSAFNQGASYQWQDNSTTSNFTITNTGVYKVSVTNGNCTAVDSVEVIYYEPPTVNLGPNRSVCFGETVVLDAFNPGATYEWQDGSTNSNFLVSSPGVYSVTAKRNGCETFSSVRIDYVERPQLDLGEDTLLCEGSALQLIVNEPGATFRWQNGSTSNRFTVERRGLYWVELSLNGCLSRDSIFVDYELLPNINFGIDKTVCFGDAFFLDAYEPNTTSYLWQDGFGGARYIINESGFYYVVATNRCGTDSDSINVIIEDCNCTVYLPNVFTPDGDGNNDFFGPVYACDLVNYQMLIFNRWGELLYESVDVNSPWDGLGSDGPLPNGSYVYRISYQERGNIRTEQLKGTISIIN